MAFRWSSENVVVEHKDLQANAMALHSRGRFALLAGRRNIAVIDLENPQEILRRMSRNQQKYDVSAAEWNHVTQMEHAFVLAVGEKAEIFTWCEGILSNETTLRAHTRTITDLNWHRSDSNLLATCSIDTFIHIWDTRETRKPVISFSAIAGASQVKWNKLNSTYLASSHDCDIRIWDFRKSTQPISYITAHLSKINGLDWSPNHENQIVSSSNDSTVKFFDITNARKSEMQIVTQSPVWRARYTPFGEGIITVVVPPLRRGDNSLHLWSLADCSSSIHTFVGHSDIVLEFEWRFIDQEFQLVTWSKDNCLRIWGLDHQLLKHCGYTIPEEEGMYANNAVDIETSDTDTLLGTETMKEDTVEGSEPGSDVNHQFNRKKVSQLTSPAQAINTDSANSSKREPPKTLDIVSNQQNTWKLPSGTSSLRHTVSTNSPADSSLSTPSTTSSNALTPQLSVQSEFSSVNSFSDKAQGYSINITKDLENNVCRIHMAYGSITAIVEVTFLSTYPKSPPTFKFCSGSNIDGTAKTELLRVVKSTALHYFKKRKPCLDHCIKIFVAQLRALLSEEHSTLMDFGVSSTPLVNNSYFLQMYGSQQDYSIPFPRTSGARFGGSGLLVCFARPTQQRKCIRSSRAEPSTPRSLSALGAYAHSLYPQIASATTPPKYNYMYSVGQSPTVEQPVSVSVYYNQDKKGKGKRGKSDSESSRQQDAVIVTVYDVTKLMPISKELAGIYMLDEQDRIGSCNRNRDAALSVGRKDLAQVWSITASILGLNPNHGLANGFPWWQHPFSRKTMMAIIDYYHVRHDVQTAAMLTCLLGERAQVPPGSVGKPRTTDVPANMRNLLDRLWRKAGGSPYNTIHSINTDGIDISSLIRHNRSNSEGSLTDASRPSTDSNCFIAENSNRDKRNISLLEGSKMDKYEELRRAYSEILYRWDLLEQRAMVNKYIHSLIPAHKGVDFLLECFECNQLKRMPYCLHYKQYPFSCSICHLSVKGSSILCLVCGHGGHSSHYMEWFEEHTECPIGCGCECTTEVEQLFN